MPNSRPAVTTLFTLSPMKKVCLIVNPTAGRGRAARLLPEIRRRLGWIDEHDINLTAKSGDEELLAFRAIDNDCSTIVVVGGDGTCSRVANAILQRGSGCRLGVIPCGTGNDFAKTLGVGNLAPEDAAAIVARPQSSQIDVGRADRHYFLNSCGFGFDASVLEATKNVRFLKGNTVYIYSALAQLFSYRGISVSVNAGPNSARRKMLMVTVSNGKFLGGAFRIAPLASVLDGMLDVAFFGDSNIVERVRTFVSAFRGTHLRLASVKTVKAPAITLNFSEPPAMEIDGELRRATSSTVKIECVPRALSVVAAPGALL